MGDLPRYPYYVRGKDSILPTTHHVYVYDLRSLAIIWRFDRPAFVTVVTAIVPHLRVDLRSTFYYDPPHLPFTGYDFTSRCLTLFVPVATRAPVIPPAHLSTSSRARLRLIAFYGRLIYYTRFYTCCYSGLYVVRYTFLPIRWTLLIAILFVPRFPIRYVTVVLGTFIYRLLTVTICCTLLLHDSRSLFVYGDTCCSFN